MSILITIVMLAAFLRPFGIRLPLLHWLGWPRLLVGVFAIYCAETIMPAASRAVAGPLLLFSLLATAFWVMAGKPGHRHRRQHCVRCDVLFRSACCPSCGRTAWL